MLRDTTRAETCLQVRIKRAAAEMRQCTIHTQYLHMPISMSICMLICLGTRLGSPVASLVPPLPPVMSTFSRRDSHLRTQIRGSRLGSLKLVLLPKFGIYPLPSRLQCRCCRDLPVTSSLSGHTAKTVYVFALYNSRARASPKERFWRRRMII